MYTVYVIKNLVNGKQYVGQTIRDLSRYLSIQIRLALRGNTNKPYLYGAIRKYGANAFQIKGLVACQTKEESNSEERRLIAELGTRGNGYNLTEGGDGGDTFSNRQHTLEARRKIALSKIGKPRPDVAERNKTLENRVKVGLSQKGKIVSKETCMKISLTRAGKSYPKPNQQVAVQGFKRNAFGRFIND
jgi:group I intron endonuclease